MIDHFQTWWSDFIITLRNLLIYYLIDTDNVTTLKKLEKYKIKHFETDKNKTEMLNYPCKFYNDIQLYLNDNSEIITNFIF